MDKLIQIKLSPAQERMARTFEGIVEKEIRTILELLGMTIKRDTETDVIQNQMKLMGISIMHYSFENAPSENGWYIKQHGKLLLIISEPYIENGRIKIKRRAAQ